jgi:hypothetical protein
MNPGVPRLVVRDSRPRSGAGGSAPNGNELEGRHRRPVQPALPGFIPIRVVWLG